MISVIRTWARVHATDFLDPRQGYWKAVDPKPTGDRQVPIFLIGKVLHSFVLGSMDGHVDINVTDEGSRFSEDLGFWYSPDWDKGDIAEFKTSRMFSEPRTLEDLRTYLEQVLIYMVAKNRTSAKLWCLYLNLKDNLRRTAPDFRAYTIGVSEDDLSRLRDHIRGVKGELERILSERDTNPEGYRALPLCREFKCGARGCEWYEQCKPEGRYGQPRWDGPDRREAVEVSDPSEVPGPSQPARKRRSRTVRKPRVQLPSIVSDSAESGSEGDPPAEEA